MKKILIIILVLGFVKWWFTDPSISVSNNTINLSYVVKYTGNSSRGDTLPMLVALHGNGDTPENFYATALDLLTTPARVVLIKGPVSRSRGSSWPWTPADFEKYGEAVSEAVELLAIKYSTVNKPVLFGFSGGGMMAYYQALKHGNSYSYIFPVSGKMSKELLGSNYFRSGAKVTAFHGKSDTVVSFSGGKAGVALLKAQDVKVKFIEFNGGHHGVFNEMKPEITRLVEQQLQKLN